MLSRASHGKRRGGRVCLIIFSLKSYQSNPNQSRGYQPSHLIFLKACLSPHSGVVSALLILAACSQVANHCQSVAEACLVVVSPLILQHLKGSLCSFSYSTETIISTSTNVSKEGVQFIDKFCSESLLIMFLGKHFFVKIMLENTE